MTGSSERRDRRRTYQELVFAGSRLRQGRPRIPLIKLFGVRDCSSVCFAVTRRLRAAHHGVPSTPVSVNEPPPAARIEGPHCRDGWFDVAVMRGYRIPGKPPHETVFPRLHDPEPRDQEL
jgi:hypothetical protein